VHSNTISTPLRGGGTGWLLVGSRSVWSGLGTLGGQPGLLHEVRDRFGDWPGGGADRRAEALDPTRRPAQDES